MKVSVIIITYNNAKHIKETLNSVISQSFKDWNCFIIDNSSSDNTHEIIERLIKSDGRFKVFQKENEGPSAARNFGFNKLQNDVEYVHFLDGDDTLNENFLYKMVSYLDSHKNVGLVGCQFNVIDFKGAFIGKGFRSRFAQGFLNFPKQLPDATRNTPFITFFSATGQGPFAVFRACVFKETTGYQKEFWSHEDSDIFCQMALRSEVHFLPDRLYNKRVHENNLTYSSKANYALFRKKWDYYKSTDAKTNTLIERSLVYYYTKHKPLRDFKVALKALRECLGARDKEMLRWALICFKTGLNDLFLRKNLKIILKQRASEHLD